MVFVPVEDRGFIPVFFKTVHDIQDAFHSLVQHFFFQASVPHRFHDQLIIHPAGGGHLQIQPRFQVRYPVVDRAPVAHHKAVESPFPAQHVREHFLILCRVNAVDPVVGAHHRPGLLLSHRALKGRQIDLSERALVDFGGGRHPAVLLVVRQEMLDAGAHVFALYAADQRAGHLGGHIGVFRIIFKIPAAQRGTLDVYRGPQDHAHAFRLAFLSQRLSHFPDQFPVKAGRRAAACRKADRLDAVVYAQIVRLLILLSQPVRSVGNHHCRDPQPFDCLRMPEIRPGTHGSLFLQRHFRDPFP